MVYNRYQWRTIIQTTKRMQRNKNQEKYKTTQNKGSDVKEIRVITKLPNSEQSYKMILIYTHL